MREMISRLWDRWDNWCDHRAIHRLAAGRPIQRGEWLLDLGMPTLLAVRIKGAWHLQQGDPCTRCS